MPVIRSGSFTLYGYSWFTGWTDGSLGCSPIGPDPSLVYATNEGSCPTGLPATAAFSGPTLLDTTTEGTGLNPSAPPAGWVLNGAPGAVTLFPDLNGTGVTWEFKLTLGGELKDWLNTSSPSFAWTNVSMLSWLDLISAFTAECDALGGLSDWHIKKGPSTTLFGPRVLGAYSIVWDWWKLPDKDSCGNPQDSHLVLAATSPGPGYQLLDPAHPDTAQPTVIVNSVEPSVGTTAGGTAVTIKGSGFGDGATVKFDGVAATSVVVVDQYQITCDSPAHAAGTGNVVVTNLDGTHN